MAAGIYGIYNGGELLYIGRSGNMKARWGSHRRDLAANRHHCQGLQEWYNARESWERILDFQVIEELDSPSVELISAREEYWFNLLLPPHWSRLPGAGMDWGSISPARRQAIYRDRSKQASIRRAAFMEEHGETIVEMYMGGTTLEEIATQLGEGVSYAAVRRVLLERGITPRKQRDTIAGEWRRGKTAGEMREILLEAMEIHPSWEKRAKHLGTSTSAIREAAKDLGLLTPKKVYTYRNLIEDVGEQELTALLNARYIHGGELADDIAESLGVGRKVVLSAIAHLELEDDGRSAVERGVEKTRVRGYHLTCTTCGEPFIGSGSRAKRCEPCREQQGEKSP